MKEWSSCFYLAALLLKGTSRNLANVKRAYILLSAELWPSYRTYCTHRLYLMLFGLLTTAMAGVFFQKEWSATTINRASSTGIPPKRCREGGCCRKCDAPKYMCTSRYVTATVSILVSYCGLSQEDRFMPIVFAWIEPLSEKIEGTASHEQREARANEKWRSLSRSNQLSKTHIAPGSCSASNFPGKGCLFRLLVAQWERFSPEFSECSASGLGLWSQKVVQTGVARRGRCATEEWRGSHSAVSRPNSAFRSVVSVLRWSRGKHYIFVCCT